MQLSVSLCVYPDKKIFLLFVQIYKVLVVFSWNHASRNGKLTELRVLKFHASCTRNQYQRVNVEYDVFNGSVYRFKRWVFCQTVLWGHRRKCKYWICVALNIRTKTYIIIMSFYWFSKLSSLYLSFIFLWKDSVSLVFTSNFSFC